MSLFDMNGPLMYNLGKLANIFLCNVLFCLFSLPIFTIGAALSALFACMQAIWDEDEDDIIAKQYWNAFKQNFRQATILWLLVLAAAGFLAVDLWACMQIAIPSWVRMVCFGVLLCLSLIFALTALYLFPVLSRFHLPIKTILPHSFIMAMGNLYISVTVLVTYIIFGVLSFYIPILFPVFMALAAFISSYLFRYVFTRYQEDGEDQ